MTDTYIVQDPDEAVWYVYAAKPYNSVNDTPTAVVAGEPFATQACAKANWWSCTVKPDSLMWEMPDSEYVAEYRLPEGTTIPDWPATLTREEFLERQDDDDVCGPLALYERITETVPQDPVVIDLSDAKVLRSQGPDDAQVPAGCSWRAELPIEVRERSEYLWLFPGYLSDVRDALKRRIELMPGTRKVYSHEEFVVHPTIGEGWRKRLNSRIDGSDLADAVAKFEAWVVTIADEAGVNRKACECCAGKGYVG